MPQGPISIPSAVVFPQGRRPRQGRQAAVAAGAAAVVVPQGGLRVNDPSFGSSPGSESAVATGGTALGIAQQIGILGGGNTVNTGRVNENPFQTGVNNVFNSGGAGGNFGGGLSSNRGGQVITTQSTVQQQATGNINNVNNNNNGNIIGNNNNGNNNGNNNNQPPFIVVEQTIEEDIVPSVVIEETITEDATVPEQVAQEVIIKDGTITHIGAGPYNGFLQGS